MLTKSSQEGMPEDVRGRFDSSSVRMARSFVHAVQMGPVLPHKRSRGVRKEHPTDWNPVALEGSSLAGFRESQYLVNAL